jgi:hypothetical protein
MTNLSSKETIFNSIFNIQNLDVTDNLLERERERERERDCRARAYKKFLLKKQTQLSKVQIAGGILKTYFHSLRKEIYLSFRRLFFIFFYKPINSFYYASKVCISRKRNIRLL